MEWSRRLCYNNLLSIRESLNQLINEFKTNIKAVFMNELLDKLDKAFRIDKETFRDFDVFNADGVERRKSAGRKFKLPLVVTEITWHQNLQKKHIGKTLIRFQGTVNKWVQLFFDYFHVATATAEKKQNEIMLNLIKKGELKQNDVNKYKDEHPIQSDKVYSHKVTDREQCPEIMKLLSYCYLSLPALPMMNVAFQYWIWSIKNKETN